MASQVRISDAPDLVAQLDSYIAGKPELNTWLLLRARDEIVKLRSVIVDMRLGTIRAVKEKQ